MCEGADLRFRLCNDKSIEVQGGIWIVSLRIVMNILFFDYNFSPQLKQRLRTGCKKAEKCQNCVWTLLPLSDFIRREWITFQMTFKKPAHESQGHIHSWLQAEKVYLKLIKLQFSQSLICFCKMWKSRLIFLAFWLSLIPLQAMEQHEVVGLAELTKDFLPLSNTELVFISDFNSEMKVSNYS